jgi:hypothetical protein
LFLFAICIAVWACSKEEQLVKATTNSSGTKTPDVVYHYKGKEYPLYLIKGSMNEFIQDENTKALDQIVGSVSGMGTFTFSDKPANHFYLFDSEFDGYDYIEKNGKPLIGRKFKHAYRIDELRDRLWEKYGEDINYTNPAIYADALAGIEAIHAELKIDTDLPRDLEFYIGEKTTGQNGQRSPLMTLYENTNFGGSSLNVETASNTSTWTHGPYNCYRTTANPDLAQVSWNDRASSSITSFQSGADAVGYAYYKDTNYARYFCGLYLSIIYSGGSGIPDMTQTAWSNFPLFCTTMNDQISSVRIKVIWQGCTVDFSDID